MGHCVSTNIASLHQGNKCSGYSGLILGFGLFGDVMRDCEKSDGWEPVDLMVKLIPHALMIVNHNDLRNVHKQR